MAENKTAGWWLAWVAVPTLIVGGASVAMVAGGTPGIAAGSATVLATAFVLLRRFIH